MKRRRASKPNRRALSGRQICGEYIENTWCHIFVKILNIFVHISSVHLSEAPNVQTKPAALSGRQRQTTSSLSSHLVNTVVNCMISAISIIIVVIMIFTMIILTIMK